MSNLIQAVKANTAVTPENWRDVRKAMTAERDERHAKAAELEAQAAALRGYIKKAPDMSTVISHFQSERDAAHDAIYAALDEFAADPKHVFNVMVCAGRFPVNGSISDIVGQLGQNVVDVGVAALLCGHIPRGCDLGRWMHSQESERVNAFDICKRNGLALDHIADYERAVMDITTAQQFERSTF